ncbi:hypothetical protein [Hyphomicrobium sp. D-2]|uniref:hypothetical protein n=1 Tax=Hyphomicrobium sp. D-2 TaxID=3041621 RepID=UPI0024551A86|nr:hypothetical protein [Hyphomicrobium sp. D-2]MDH4983020.1 hypothetical protein [Hyphomicrobium sp. D-2]
MGSSVNRMLTGMLGQSARALTRVLDLLASGVRQVWLLLRPPLLFALNVLAALIVLFEEWGWRPLSAALAKLARFPLWAHMERSIAALPPYGALLVFTVPSVVLIPAKLIGVYMFATGHFIVALIVIFLAKIISTALIARIFELTQPALMQIGWFAYAYNKFIPWKDRVFAWLRASWVWRVGRVIKWRTMRSLRAGWQRWKPTLRASFDGMKQLMRDSAKSLAERARALTARLGLQRFFPSRSGAAAPKQLAPPKTQI